jgi:ATP-dependent RNA helicase DOB1
MTVDQEEVISDYYDLRQQLDIMNKDLRDVTNHPTYALPFLQPGRMVRVSHNKQDWGWGVVVNYQKRMGPKASRALFGLVC